MIVETQHVALFSIVEYNELLPWVVNAKNNWFTINAKGWIAFNFFFYILREILLIILAHILNDTS
jgi:hypothetical protein